MIISSKKAFIHPRIENTPDVQRFVEKPLFAEYENIDYARLPLQLHPNFLQITKNRLKNRKKFKPKKSETKKVLNDKIKRIKDKLESENSQSGEFSKNEIEEIGKNDETEEKVSDHEESEIDEEEYDAFNGDYGGTVTSNRQLPGRKCLIDNIKICLIF